ncbi:hypothetical protein NMY22_g8464 [Coprinellus aureogranulatus]|nr:hypothetical protein NMY22_g8464 [Coprinellus aureogranulatus]
MDPCPTPHPVLSNPTRYLLQQLPSTPKLLTPMLGMDTPICTPCAAPRHSPCPLHFGTLVDSLRLKHGYLNVESLSLSSGLLPPVPRLSLYTSTRQASE